MRPSTRFVTAVAATTCCIQWRHDARVLGSLLLVHWGLWSADFLCTDATHAVSRVPLFCGSWAAFSLGCQPGSSESAPCVTWSVLGSPPVRAFHHCPLGEGGSQRACTHGFWVSRRSGVVLAVGPAFVRQLGRSLGMPARGPSRPLQRLVGTPFLRGSNCLLGLMVTTFSRDEKFKNSPLV